MEESSPGSSPNLIEAEFSSGVISDRNHPGNCWQWNCYSNKMSASYSLYETIAMIWCRLARPVSLPLCISFLLRNLWILNGKTWKRERMRANVFFSSFHRQSNVLKVKWAFMCIFGEVIYALYLYKQYDLKISVLLLILGC